MNGYSQLIYSPFLLDLQACFTHSAPILHVVALYPYHHSYLRLAFSFESRKGGKNSQGRNGYVEARPLLLRV